VPRGNETWNGYALQLGTYVEGEWEGIQLKTPSPKVFSSFDLKVIIRESNRTSRSL
jgi:hypothetical protein